MAKRWSNFRLRLESLADPCLQFRIYYLAYPMRSARGQTDLPRCYITIHGNIVWDFPSDFSHVCDSPYGPVIASEEISKLLQMWRDTRSGDLMSFRDADSTFRDPDLPRQHLAMFLSASPCFLGISDDWVAGTLLNGCGIENDTFNL
ncbi:MAG: hypothetical protein KDB27_04085, partial [Planctomycetales bacterium]|nr:hypothetical protein [Planctomycetales bacterium]